jgi:hypothetical protein
VALVGVQKAQPDGNGVKRFLVEVHSAFSVFCNVFQSALTNALEASSE